MILMAAGVGLFGTFSGFLAAWLLGPGAEEPDGEIAALRQEVSALRQSIDAMHQR
jgi:voltage-gated potassium channel